MREGCLTLGSKGRTLRFSESDLLVGRSVSPTLSTENGDSVFLVVSHSFCFRIAQNQCVSRNVCVMTFPRPACQE